MLQTTVQEDGTVSDFDSISGKDKLTEDQVKLLMEISEQFSPEDSAADLSILYETTGFQAESDNFQFWENYQDFEELGSVNLVRQDKNEQIIAMQSNKNATKKKVAIEDGPEAT